MQVWEGLEWQYVSAKKRKQNVVDGFKSVSRGVWEGWFRKMFRKKLQGCCCFAVVRKEGSTSLLRQVVQSQGAFLKWVVFLHQNSISLLMRWWEIEGRKKINGSWFCKFLSGVFCFEHFCPGIVSFSDQSPRLRTCFVQVTLYTS